MKKREKESTCASALRIVLATASILIGSLVPASLSQLHAEVGLRKKSPPAQTDSSWRFAKLTSSPASQAPLPPLQLAFSERVAYQYAIEEIYWRHRIWPKQNSKPKPSLGEVMTRQQVEKKVEEYLGNSQALEDYWQRPITTEQLQAEMNRMAQHTKQPKVLGELFAVLGNDPFVIAECLVRPVLAQRLVTELKNEERVELTKVAWLKQPFQSLVARARTQAVNANYTLSPISSSSGICTDDTWTPTSTTNTPSARFVHTAVWTGTEVIVWGGSRQQQRACEQWRPLQSEHRQLGCDHHYRRARCARASHGGVDWQSNDRLGGIRRQQLPKHRQRI